MTGGHAIIDVWEEINDITQRMLTLTLRNLERNRIITRHYVPQIPPRVEYELTDIGRGDLHALKGFNFRTHDNLDVIQAHRRASDQADLLPPGRAQKRRACLRRAVFVCARSLYFRSWPFMADLWRPHRHARVL